MTDKKVFCVTGAASVSILFLYHPNVRAMKVLMLVKGIGRATAIRMAETGATGLALSDLNLDDLEETAKLCKQ